MKNELLLAHLRGDADFEENLAKYHRCRKAKKPKADAARVSSARALAGENGDRKRKREGGENGDRDRKGGDRAQQQAAGREGGRAGGENIYIQTLPKQHTTPAGSSPKAEVAGLKFRGAI